MRIIVPLFVPLAACGPAADLDLDLAQSDVVPTVFTASVDGWTDGLDAAWVEYGLDGNFDRSVSLDIDSEAPWETTLLGMKEGSDYEVRIAVEIDGEAYTGRSHTASTGMVPADFADLSLERTEDQSLEGYLATSILGNASAAVILDEDGDYVWWYQPDGVESVGRTFLSRDGTAIYTMDLNSHGREDGSFTRISLDGSELETTALDWAHHEIFEHEDGSIAFLAKDPATIDGQEITGDSIQELNPDGSVTTIWSAWDTLDVLPFDPDDAKNGEWPHANALDYLPEEDAYLVSFLFLDAIARIDRASGSIDWIMGGDASDFVLAGGGTDIFERTHQMHRLDDSLLVFVNGSQQGGDSYVVEYAMDEQTLEVEPVWEYWSDPSLNCISLGDVSRLGSGNTLITYSYSGQIQEVTPEGEPVWVLSANAGGVIGYTTLVDVLSMD